MARAKDRVEEYAEMIDHLIVATGAAVRLDREDLRDKLIALRRECVEGMRAELHKLVREDENG